MQDDEDIGPGGARGSQSASDGTSPGTSPDPDSCANAGNAPDADGWQHYRKWISTAPAPRSRRGSVDPALYTWKGYRNWTEQIKRNWSDS